MPRRSLVPAGFNAGTSDVLVTRRLEAAREGSLRVTLSEDQNGGATDGRLILELDGVDCTGVSPDRSGAMFELSPAVARALFALLQDVAAVAELRGFITAEPPAAAERASL